MGHDHWPNDVHTEQGDHVVFMPIIATIGRVFDNQYGLTYIFKEDPSPRKTKDGKEYKGEMWKVHPNSTDPKFVAGDQVKVRLEMKRGEKGGRYYNVDKIGPPGDVPANPADALPAKTATMPPPQAIAGNDQIPAEFTMPLDYYREKQRTERASFERQGVLHRLTDVVVALPALVEAGITTKAQGKKLLADWQSRASHLWNRHGAWDEVGVPEAGTFRSDEQPPDQDAADDGGEDTSGAVDDLPWDPDEVQP